MYYKCGVIKLTKLGEFIKSERIKKDLGLREFARKADLSHTYVGMLEKNNNIEPTIEALAKIAHALNINLDKLLYISGYTEQVSTEYLYKKNLKQEMLEMKEHVANDDKLSESDKQTIISLLNTQIAIAEKY